MKMRLWPALLLALAPSLASAADGLPDDPVLRGLQRGDAAEADKDAATLLEIAQALKAYGARPADGQEDLAALWERQAENSGVQRPALEYRGRALGPAYRRGALVPGGSLTMRQLFLGGQRAHILVSPANGAANLSMRVLGADGGTLCAKLIGGPQADCAWMPVFTDRFDIVIENGGASPAIFYMVMR